MQQAGSIQSKKVIIFNNYVFDVHDFASVSRHQQRFNMKKVIGHCGNLLICRLQIDYTHSSISSINTTKNYLLFKY
jgi:hypothetical protein